MRSKRVKPQRVNGYNINFCLLLSHACWSHRVMYDISVIIVSITPCHAFVPKHLQRILHMIQNISYTSKDTWSCSFSKISATLHTYTYAKGHMLFMWFLFSTRQRNVLEPPSMLIFWQCRSGVECFMGWYFNVDVELHQTIHMHSCSNWS